MDLNAFKSLHSLLVRCSPETSPDAWVSSLRLISCRTMKLTAFQVHKSWLIRVVLVLLATALADGAVVWFAQRPILWAVLIPGSLPLSMFAFVAIPILHEEKRKSRIGISGRR
jgi:hypothetical protein